MTPKRIQELLAAFFGKRILVVGDVMLDQYISGRVERLNPEAPVPVLHAHGETVMTGGAGNAAKNVASLGGKATLVSVIGEDESAPHVIAAAQTEGYEVKFVVDRSRPTTRKARYLVGGQQLLRVDWETTPDISDEVAHDVRESVQQMVDSGVEAILVSDYAKGVITARIAQEILALAKKAGVPVAADVKPSRITYFTGATFIAPNLKEAHEYLGINHLIQGGPEVAVLAETLREKFETDVFLTLSAKGVYVCTRDGVREEVPQEHTVAVADTSGAGDTSLAAMLLARLSGATPVEMAEIANAAGAVVVGKVGAVGVTTEEVSNMLTHHHEI